MKGRSQVSMRGMQDPSAGDEKVLFEQLTQASRNAVAPNIDPAIAGVAPAPVPIMGGNAAATAASAVQAVVDADGDRKGAKRELSTSKRAAQNRAAQRAFRQRKEGHIKKLEEKVRDYGVLLEHFKLLQNENLSLRDYIISLQGRLIEAQGEYPQPPAHVNLNASREDQLPPAIQDALGMHGVEDNAGDGSANQGSDQQDDAEMQDDGPDSAAASASASAPANGRAAPTAMMGVSQAAQTSLQGTAAQAQAVVKGSRRSQRDRGGEEKSIEERTDPALK